MAAEAVEQQSDDRRSDLSAAFDAAESGKVATPAEPLPPSQSPTIATGTDAEPAKAEAKPAAEGERARGPDGKFLPKAAVPPAPAGKQDGVVAPVAAIGATQTTPPAAVKADFWEKPPQSLKPELHEKWKALDPEIRQAFVRRDRDAAVATQRYTETARQAEPLLRALQPFLPTLQQRGMDPVQTIGNFLRTEQALADPNPQTRAAVLAQAIRTYNVPIEALAAALDGTAQPQAQPQIDPQQIVAQAEQRILQRMDAQRQQAAEATAHAELQQFEASAEFLEPFNESGLADPGSIRALMAAQFQQMADDNRERRAQGMPEVDLTMQEAYDRACWAHPQTRAVLQQREASKQAATSAQATQRAHAAGSSVKSQPGGPSAPTPPGDDWRSHLSAAWDAAEGR